MTAPAMKSPSVKGWCPTLMTPMMSGDGLLVRVKPAAARLSADAARAIADAARRFGNGAIDLTNRGNLQSRGLSEGSVEPFAAVVLDHGLADPDPEAEAVRNVLCDPLGADDPSARFDSHALARKLDAMLVAEPKYRALPDKFGLLVDAGGQFGLGGVSADILVRGGEVSFALALDGADVVAKVPPAEVFDAVARLLAVFLSYRDAADPPRRMRSLVADIGAATVFAEAGLVGRQRHDIRNAVAATPDPIGFKAIAESGRGVVGVGATFGQVDVPGLDTLADLASRFGDGTLRVPLYSLHPS